MIILTEELVAKGKTWFRELSDLSRIEIPRCLQLYRGEVKSTDLHTFVDASQDAYGAVVYQRCVYNDGIDR
jgi:hypothetical protein